MTSDILIHESPALPRWTVEDEQQLLAETYAEPQPAPSEGGSDGGHHVRTQRGLPDPDPERPARSRMTWHEWQLSHAGDISGRDTFVSAFERNGGKRLLSREIADMPVIPELRYRGVIGPDRVVRNLDELLDGGAQVIRAPIETLLPATRVRTRRETDDLVWFVAAIAVVLLLGAAIGAVLVSR